MTHTFFSHAATEVYFAHCRDLVASKHVVVYNFDEDAFCVCALKHEKSSVTELSIVNGLLHEEDDSHQKKTCEPRVDRMLSAMDRAVLQAGIRDSDVDRVVVAGESDDLEPLVACMRRRFGNRAFFPSDSRLARSAGDAPFPHIPESRVAAQDVSVVLADGTPYYLLRSGEPVSDWRKTLEIGITDASQTLRVVFSGSADIDEDEARVRTIQMRGYGFLQEKLTLESRVGRDLLLRVRVRSAAHPEHDAVVWEYDRLKLTYDAAERRRK